MSCLTAPIRVKVLIVYPIELGEDFTIFQGSIGVKFSPHNGGKALTQDPNDVFSVINENEQSNECFELRKYVLKV